MNITDYILNEIKPLNLKSSLKTAKKMFGHFSITHFVVVENNAVLGCFAQEDMYMLGNKTDTLDAYTYLLHSFFANEKATILELLKIFSDNSTTIVPVVNKEMEYIGYYSLCDVLELFSASPFMMENGETLVIEKRESNSSISEVSQIVESNGGKLLGLYLSEEQQGLVQITLKVCTESIHKIMHTFRSYNYKVVSIHENDVYLEDLKTGLITYKNI